LKRQKRALFALTIFLISILLFTSCRRGSPLRTGSWNDDIFTNTWTNITFELPAEFWAVDSPGDTFGQVTDFHLIHDAGGTSISMTYIDVTSQNDTAEDYLNMMREQMANHSGRTRLFPDYFESTTIAGREFLVMRTKFFQDDNPNEIFFQDAYVHRFVGTMLLLLITFSSDTADSVASFTSSIHQIQERVYS